MDDFFKKLVAKLEGAQKIVFMGIGEEKLSDDGVGPFIISELLTYSNDRFLFINAGTDPMARIDDIINFKPTHLVLLDTCTLNKPPGTVALIERDKISSFVPISTHTIPVHVVIDLIFEKLPNLITFMIGIVPESLDGFFELKQFKDGAVSLEEFEQNIDLPFFEIKLTDTIQHVAHQLIIMIKKIINQI